MIGRRLAAFVAIAYRDAHVLMSYRSTVTTRPLGVLFNLALFYFISRLVNVARFPDPDSYFAFVAIGIVIYGLVRSTLGVPEAVRQELLAGTYERLEVSALGGTAAIAAMFISPFLYELLLAAFALAISALVFGVDVRWATAPLGIPLGALGALAFAPFALVFAAVTLAFKRAPGQGAVLATIALVSGLYFPVELLPGWLRWMSDVQPFTPMVDLMRHVLIGLPLEDPPALALLRLVGFVVIGVPAAVWVVSAARRFARRTGTILES